MIKLLIIPFTFVKTSKILLSIDPLPHSHEGSKHFPLYCEIILQKKYNREFFQIINYSISIC